MQASSQQKKKKRKSNSYMDTLPRLHRPSYARTLEATHPKLVSSEYKKSIHHVHLFYATLTPPHATLGADLGAGASDLACGCDCACGCTGLGGIGNGLFLSASSTRCACSVLRINQPAYRRPTVDSAMCTIFCRPTRRKKSKISVPIRKKINNEANAPRQRQSPNHSSRSYPQPKAPSPRYCPPG